MDDVLLFAEASPGQADLIKQGLMEFCDASGQLVNYDKSLLYISPNVSDDDAAVLSGRLGVVCTMDLGKYLGYYLAHDVRINRTPKEVVSKAKGSLASWKLRCLSKAGRATLASSMLNTISIFHMQIMRLPVGCLKSLTEAVVVVFGVKRKGRGWYT